METATQKGRVVRLAGYRRRVTYTRLISKTMESIYMPHPVYIKISISLFKKKKPGYTLKC